MNQGNKAKLVLEDGTVFEGFSFGSETSTAGEVVFNTGMVGYPEVMTDPSYKGQILILTYPLIGNYGVPPSEKDNNNIEKNFESSSIQIQGLVISNYCKNHNHWKSTRSLSDWMKEHNIPGICGIDTRALTKKIREKGVMLGKIIISNDVELYDPNKENMVAKVSAKETKTYGSGKYKIIVIDCGMKNNILRCLLKRDVTLKVVPWDYDFHQEQFDGIFISNGPGDPKMCQSTIANLRKAFVLGKPIFGICMGNQILGLAAGADTFKLKYGHRSQNQPCIDSTTKRCYITSQNHGYAVDDKTLPNDWEIWFTNANDQTNEGIRHKQMPYFSVQFHPEAKAGPEDTEFLFDLFIECIKNG